MAVTRLGAGVLEKGDTLGIYQIEERLAPGGMGEVYCALDPRLNRRVAVKILTKQAESRAARRRFFREARALAALSHPNIVVIHDLGDEDGIHYIVSEFLEGMTLGEVLESGPLAWRDAAEIAIEIVAGLGAAHSIGLVHRDLKPSNVFRTRDRRIKILDFGLVFHAEGYEPRGAEESDTKTAPMAGTGGYMSPEQIESTGVDHRSDIFGFGCVLYEMLTGQRAFQAPTLIGTLKSVVCDEPVPLSEVVQGVPPALETVIGRCLAKKPEARYASAREIELALRAISRGESPRSPGVVRTGRHLFGRLLRRLRRDDGRIRALAVLPFVNASGELSAEPLNEAVPEALIRRLSTIEGLRVIAWGTVARYRGSTLSPDQVGTDLGVDAVLTGRLLKHESGLQVTVEMIASAGGEHLWGERIASAVADLGVLQEDLAERIGRSLEQHLRGVPPQPAEMPTSEAPMLYMRGRFFWSRRDPDDLERSRRCFEKALERDPGLAAARSGLADVWSVQPFWGLAPPSEAFPRAREEAVRALALEPRLGEAHASLAYIRFYYDWDWKGAEAAFEEAIRCDPEYATAYHWAGMAAALRKDFATGFQYLERARELDPLSLMVAADAGLIHYLAGNPEQTLELCRNASELDDRFVPARIYTGLALAARGDYDEAAVILEQAVDQTRGSAPALASLAYCVAQAGQRDWAVEILGQLRATARTAYVSSYHLAVVQAALDKPADAVASLREAVTQRSEMLVWLPTDPRLAELREDPRVGDILELFTGRR